LWRERCQARDVHVSWREFALIGAIGVPLLLLATTAGASSRSDQSARSFTR
jgi:hypothetical protein